MLKYSFDSSNNAKTILEHGNVGIGLTNPLFHLDVSGDINISGSINQAGSEYIGSQWTTVNTDEIHYSTGNVGIGTNNPTVKLDVNGDINSENASIFDNNVYNQAMFGHKAGKSTAYAFAIMQGSDGSTMVNAKNVTAGQISELHFGIRGGEKFKLLEETSGGSCRLEVRNNTNFCAMKNVGIGTTDPKFKLDIGGGGVRIANSTGSGNDVELRLTTYSQAGDAKLLFSNAGYGAGVASRAHKVGIISEADGGWGRGQLHFCINNSSGVGTTEDGDTASISHAKMTITRDGNVGIGTTSPVYPLVLWTSQTTQQDTTYYSGNPDNYSTNVNPDGTDNYNYAAYGSIYAGMDRNSLDVSDTDRVFNGANAYGLSLFAKGGLYTRGALISASDRRIKTNIVDISDNEALNTLRLIEPKKYEYIDKRERGNATTFGFIAQQIREVFPDAVKIEEDEINCFMDDSSLSEDNILTLSKTNTSDISFNYTDSSGNCYAILSIDNYLPNNPDIQSYIHVYDSNIIDSSNIQIDVSLNENYKIRECCTDASFNVNDMSGNNLYTIPANTILLNGQRVPDFHTLNKSAIFTVATAALQEVDRQLQAEKAKTATLETEVSTLKTQVTDLLARVTALESA